MNSDRGALQRKFDFAREDQPPPLAELLRAELTDPAFNDQPALGASSADALMERVVDMENLDRAWRQVRRNRGAPGPDGQPIEQVRKHLPEILAKLRKALRSGTYQPGDIRRVWIPKASGGQRGLGIPNVVDRVVQEAIRGVLEPLYEPTFHPSSHGFRPNRGCHTAIAEALSYIREGWNWQVDIDLDKFFDRVNQQRLMARLAQRVEDKRLLHLIGRMLKAKVVMPDGVKVAVEEGVPQGGPLSPLLSNIVLSELDEELSRRGHRFVRYADDCNIYVRSERAGQRVLEGIKRFLEKKLKLRVNEKKSAVGKAEFRKFLGFSIVWSRQGRPLRSIAPASVSRFKDRIKGMTRRVCGCSLEQVIKDLTPYLRGWRNYFGYCETPWALRDLDGWVRRRLRAIAWKQWKTYGRRRDALKRLGMPIRKAVEAAWKGCESNGPWAMSRDSRIQRALSPKYFVEKGLPSLAGG